MNSVDVVGNVPRLLALDVDGTLLTSTDELTDRTRRALTRAEGSGWHVALVTGRPLPIALPVVHDLGLGRYVVAANGATVADATTGTVLYQASLPGPVAVDAILRVRRAVPGLGLAVTTSTGFYREFGFETLAPLSRTEGVVVDDALPAPTEAVHSVVLFVDHLDALGLLAEVVRVLPQGVEATPSGLPGSVELTAPGVHKGRGLVELSERLGVPRRQVVAFGDGLNDREMLSWAGLGVAMGNADPATKSVADEVTASNDEDGVAVVVERLLSEHSGKGGPMSYPSGRIDAVLVCGGVWHDFDFARLELLKLLAEEERIRVHVASDYRDVDAIAATDVLVTYTCDVRPSEEQQAVLRQWVEAGGRWFALHGTNSAIDPPAVKGEDPYTTPRAFPLLADTLGSQFLSHPTIEPYPVTVSPGAQDDPLVTGIEPFEATDELYLCEYHGTLEPLLETRWTGTTHGFAEASWPDDEPRLVMYRRPLGDGCVLYFTLGHCRSHYDMVDPPFDGSFWPRLERGAWQRPEFYELLRRGLRWAIAGVERVSAGES